MCMFTISSFTSCFLSPSTDFFLFPVPDCSLSTYSFPFFSLFTSCFMFLLSLPVIYFPVAYFPIHGLLHSLPFSTSLSTAPGLPNISNFLNALRESKTPKKPHPFWKMLKAIWPLDEDFKTLRWYYKIMEVCKVRVSPCTA